MQSNIQEDPEEDKEHMFEDEEGAFNEEALSEAAEAQESLRKG